MPRIDKFPLAASGWPYLLGYLFLAVVATALCVWWMAIPLWLLSGFIAFFFRDPARDAFAPAGSVLSPADGRVVVVEEVDAPEMPEGRALMVSVFMSVFNVHVNRVPVSGLVQSVEYKTGAFVNAAHRDASHSNERIEVVLEDADGNVIKVAQVAGLVARKIECRLIPGEKVQQGHRFGMIRFGSRLDVYFPLGSNVLVSRGQRVKAGISVLGELA
ncbi:phosphatidylserine decarboxylase family protein [Patescibacteria group bacterium]|nr:phosphatidylserine decarboxylase family protein [Patescibacteria group bacterium]